jgi:hypothetical protein
LAEPSWQSPAAWLLLSGQCIGQLWPLCDATTLRTTTLSITTFSILDKVCRYAVCLTSTGRLSVIMSNVVMSLVDHPLGFIQGASTRRSGANVKKLFSL